jgi:hypothetical protein
MQSTINSVGVYVNSMLLSARLAWYTYCPALRQLPLYLLGMRLSNEGAHRYNSFDQKQNRANLLRANDLACQILDMNRRVLAQSRGYLLSSELSQYPNPSL